MAQQLFVDFLRGDIWMMAIHLENVSLLALLWPFASNTAKADALAYAVRKDKDAMLQGLLDMTVDEDRRTLLDSAFLLACEEERIGMATRLLAAGASVHAQYDQALKWACKNGRLQLVTFLLANGADPTEGYRDTNPIQIAVKRRDVDMAQALLASGGHGYYNLGDLVRVACEPPIQREMIGVLIRGGADVNYILQVAVLGTELEVATVLLEEGAGAAVGQGLLDELLYYSSFDKGGADTLRLLLKFGARAEGLLRRAVVRAKDAEMVQVLLENGATVKELHSSSFWHFEFETLPIPIVVILLKHGLDPNTKCDCNLRPSAHAIVTLAAVSPESFNMVKTLVEAGADYREGNDEALHLAAMNGHLDTVQYLLDLGASVESRCFPNFDIVSNIMHGLSGCLKATDANIVRYCEERRPHIYKCLAFLLGQYNQTDLRPYLEKSTPDARILTTLVERHPLVTKVWYDRSRMASLSDDEQARLLGGKEVLDAFRSRFQFVEHFIEKQFTPDVFRKLALMGFLPSGRPDPGR